MAVAPDIGPQDPFWLIRIKENNHIASSKDPDSYGNKIVLGQWKERMHSNKDFILYNQLKMVTFFYKETIIYSFVGIELAKKGLKLENQHYTDILTHVEETGYSQL